MKLLISTTAGQDTVNFLHPVKKNVIFSIRINKEDSKVPALDIRGVEDAGGYLCSSLVIEPGLSNLITVKQRKTK